MAKFEMESTVLLHLINSINAVIPRTSPDKDMVKRVIFNGTDLVAFGEEMLMARTLETNMFMVVPSEELVSMLTKIGNNTITLDETATLFKIKAPNFEAKMKKYTDSTLIDEANVILAQAGSEAVWTALPEDFLEGIGLCMYSTSKEASQPALRCVHVAGNVYESSDDFRISRFHGKTGIEEELLLPGPVCAQLTKFAFDAYYATDKWVLFLVSNPNEHHTQEYNTLLACKRVYENYEDTAQFMQFEGVDYHLPEGLEEDVEMVLPMCTAERDLDKIVEITLSEKIVTITGSGERGEATATRKAIEGQTANLPTTFTIHPQFFTEILKRTDNVVRVAAANDRVLFSKGNFHHIVST